MLDSQHRFHGLNSLSFAYKRGQVVRGSQISLRYAVNTRRKTYRAAIVVSKKVDKSAVVRNRIRRRLYAAVRQQAGAINGSYDLIFTAFNAQLATADSPTLQKQVAELLRRADLRGGQTAADHDIVEQKKIREV